VANRPYRYDVFEETGFPELRQQHDTALRTVHSEFMWRAITGQADIDREWSDHVSRFMNTGGRLYLEALKRAPIVSELEMGVKVIGP
jgi:putative aldouronate transport system substrate-binding protein